MEHIIDDLTNRLFDLEFRFKKSSMDVNERIDDLTEAKEVSEREMVMLKAELQEMKNHVSTHDNWPSEIDLKITQMTNKLDEAIEAQRLVLHQLQSD